MCQYPLRRRAACLPLVYKGEAVHRSSIEILSEYAQVPARDMAGRYIASLMQYGPMFYVAHANIAIKALSIDGKVLPLVINAGTSATSYVWSPYAHYALYTIEEFRKRHAPIPTMSFRGLALPFGAALRTTSIDRVVFVNNWLWSTNPSPGLSAAQIGAVTGRLLEAYPDSAIVFRSVNPRLDPSLCTALRENDYRLVRSRRVYVLDGASPHPLQHYNTQTDLKLLHNSPYQIIACPSTLEPYAQRMAELYSALYLTKHSRLNPRFNAEFFRLTLKEHIFQYRALSRNGSIDAFVAFFVEREVMTGAVLGYAQELSQKLGLYRLAVAMLIAEATTRHLQLNLSGGVGQFKMLRGAIPVEEFDAVYDHHLPLHRRLAWTALRIAGRLSLSASQ